MGLFDFFKSHNKEIRSQLEWRKNGFHPMFEVVARYIVSKKKCTQGDIQINFSKYQALREIEYYDDDEEIRTGLGYNEVDRILIAISKADIINSKIVNYIDDDENVVSMSKKYDVIIRNHKSLNNVLEDLETLKKKVGSRDEIREQWRLYSNDKAKVLGTQQLDKNFNPIVTTDTNDACYLYLMKDYNTGYYKIGISNSPEYREKTLQSEKPTIEMICNKKYVSRRIAHSFEQALHKTFEDKRVRGEWFDLNTKDVKEIESTLNSNSTKNEN
tara:strand:+ start:1260 stop:2075 length:816 start_codon:yes stop_codon:yes gene_type:complete